MGRCSGRGRGVSVCSVSISILTWSHGAGALGDGKMSIRKDKWVKQDNTVSRQPKPQSIFKFSKLNQVRNHVDTHLR
jgi:hypothetical protein